MEETKEEEEGEASIGQFARHDTPHPKPHAPKFKKQSIDGHVIHHDEDVSCSFHLGKIRIFHKYFFEWNFFLMIHIEFIFATIYFKHSNKPPSITLNSGRKRNSDDNRAASPLIDAATINTPRSALKHPPASPPSLPSSVELTVCF